MKILIADKFPASRIDQLTAAGHDVALEPGLDAESLPGAMAGVDILIVRSTSVTGDAVAAADRLSLIIRAGAGYNTIDWQSAADRGIYVANIPGMNAIAVAELTMGLITGIDRRIADAVSDLRNGRWRKSTYSKAQGLAGRTLGIIGFGDIGAAVAQRAVAFDMRVVVEDRAGRSDESLERMELLGVELVPDRVALLGQSDIVTIHVPYNTETENMVDAAFLSQMKDGAILINTSRGEIVDEAALIRALDERGMRAGLDVYRNEPGSGEASFVSALAGHPAVYGTHHIGASTEQAQEAIADAVVGLIADFGMGQVRNSVNLEEEPVGTIALSVRHSNRVGVLARVLGVLRNSGLNVKQMQNRIFAGGVAATATIHVEGVLDDTTLAALEREEHVVGVSVGTR